MHGERVHQLQITKLREAGFGIEPLRPYRYKVTTSVCGKNAMDCLVYFDQGQLSYPPELIPPFECKLKDLEPLTTWTNAPTDLVKTMKKLRELFILDQKAVALKLQNARVNDEIGNLPEGSEVLVTNLSTGIELLLEYHLESAHGLHPKIKFVIKLMPGSQVFESVNVEYFLVEDLLSKIPKFKPQNGLLDHYMDVQMKLNQANRDEHIGKLSREEFIETVLERYRAFLIEYDDVDFMYLSMLVIISTPGVDQVLAATDILGAAVVNINLTDSFPKKLPTVILSSPLFFQDRTSCIPASRAVLYDLKTVAMPKDIGDHVW